MPLVWFYYPPVFTLHLNGSENSSKAGKMLSPMEMELSIMLLATRANSTALRQGAILKKCQNEIDL